MACHTSEATRPDSDPDDSSLHVCLLCNDPIVANNNTTKSRRHLKDFHRAAWTKAIKNEANNDNDTLYLDSETSRGDGESTIQKRNCHFFTKTAIILMSFCGSFILDSRASGTESRENTSTEIILCFF